MDIEVLEAGNMDIVSVLHGERAMENTYEASLETEATELTEANEATPADEELTDHHCPICLDLVLTQPVTCVPCSHRYCGVCLYKWLNTVLKTSRKPFVCPLCQTPVKQMDGALWDQQAALSRINHGFFLGFTLFIPILHAIRGCAVLLLISIVCPLTIIFALLVFIPLCCCLGYVGVVTVTMFHLIQEIRHVVVQLWINGVRRNRRQHPRDGHAGN